MSALPVPNLSITVTELLSTAPVKGMEASIDNAENFLALLHSGGNAADDTADKDQPAKYTRRDQDTPAATVLDMPMPGITITAAPETDMNVARADTDMTYTDRPQPAAEPAAPPVEQAARPETTTPRETATEPTENPAAESAAPATPDTQEEIPGNQHGLRDQLRHQLDAINQILAAMIQWLSGGIETTVPVVQNPASLPSATTDIAPLTVLPAAPLVIPGAITAQPQLATSAVTTDDSGPQLPAAPSALLQDMQAILQRLQQILTPSANQAVAQPQAEANSSIPYIVDDSLQTLTDALQKDVARLLQTLQQKPIPAAVLPVQPVVDSSADIAPVTIIPGSATIVTVAPAAPVVAANPADALPPEVKARLRNDISQIRHHLQKLQADNDMLFTLAKTSLQLQLSQIATPAEPTADNTLPAANTPVATVAANPLTITVQPAAPASVHVEVIPNNSNNSGGQTGSNGGQGQSAPAPVLPAGAAAAQESSAADNLTFAKALNQTAPAPRLLDQVVFHVKQSLGSGTSKIHIQLDPAELGKLHIKINVAADGKTGVTIIADNQTTLELLQKDAQNLTRALNDAGLRADSGSLNFSLSGGQQDSQGQPETQTAALNYQKAQPEEEDALPSITRSYVVNLAEGLDIII